MRVLGGLVPRLRFFMAFMAFVQGAPLGAQTETPFLGTHLEVVDTMLALAQVEPEDEVWDLGSGDGRVVLRAAERHGATGVGVELRSDLVAQARERAHEAGLADRVRFVEADLFRVDLRTATVVTTYLGPAMMARLEEHLRRTLLPGTRVVAHGIPFPEWTPERTVPVRTQDGRFTRIYLWVVPERTGGGGR